MKKISTQIILSLLVIILISGCIVQTDNQNTDSNSNNPDSINIEEPITTQPKPIIENKQPTYIGNFRIQNDNNNLEILFSLYDDKEEFMSANGYAKINVLSDNGELLYTENHRVLKTGFSKFTQTLTGKEFQAYSWKIPKSKIQKSTKSSGTAYLKFKTDRGVEFEELDASIWGLPEYTDEELTTMADAEFEKSAINLNIKKQMDDYIAVTIKRIGLMNFIDYSGKETYIRLDLKVENIGNQKISYYSPNPVILGKSNNQFEEAYVSSYDYANVLKNGDIYSGVIKEGAIFIETNGDSSPDLKELIIETGLSSYSKESRNIGDGQALIYNEEYVFKFDLSNVELK